ncbi:MAG: hypothetical protein ABUK01_02190 [Leptospirales bacterium]
MEKFKVPSKTKNILLACIGIGVISLVAGFLVDPARAWSGLLVIGWYVLTIALFGGFFTALQFIGGAKWSVVVRRVTESMVWIVPVALLLIIGVFFGLDHIYEWADIEWLKAQHFQEGKETFFNKNFFMARLLGYFVIWTLVGFWMRSVSLKQDTTKDPATRTKLTKISTGYMLFFAYSIALTAIDLIMSVEPHWYTTMFPIYCFAGLAYTGFGALILITSHVKANGGLTGMTKEHFHDLGKYQFVFTVFWGYIAFSQHMLTWYANLPEETIYLEHRLSGAWGYFTIFLWLGHFVIPLFILLSSKLKRTPHKLARVAWLTTFMGFVDVVWMVYAGDLQRHHFHDFPFKWMELGLYIGAVGIIGFVVLTAYSKVVPEPIGDPYYEDSLNFHQTH